MPEVGIWESLSEGWLTADRQSANSFYSLSPILPDEFPHTIGAPGLSSNLFSSISPSPFPAN